LKPLSVTLPFAGRFTEGGDNEQYAKCIQNPVKAKTVTLAEGGRWRRWRGFCSRFNYRLGVGLASSKRGNDGWLKKAKTNNLTLHTLVLIVTGVCGKMSLRPLKQRLTLPHISNKFVEMTIRWQHYPRSLAPSGISRQIIDVFTKHSAEITSSSHKLGSDQVLAVLADDLRAIGFQIERGKKRVTR